MNISISTTPNTLMVEFESVPLASEVAKMASDHAAHALREWLEHIGAPDAAQLLGDAIQTYSRYARHCANTPDPSDSSEPIFLPEPARKTARAAGLKEH